MSDLHDNIVEALIRAPEPMKSKDVVALCLGEQSATYMALHDLYKSGRVARLGQRGSFTYTMPDRAKKPPVSPAPLPVATTPLVRRNGKLPEDAPPVFGVTNPIIDALEYLRRKRTEIDAAIAAIEALAK